MNKANIALRNFAIAISVLTILGHTVLGFEESWAQVVVSLITTYVVEVVYEVYLARREHRPARFRGGLRKWATFVYPAHITGLAIAMLIYAGDRLMPFVFAAAMSICSKIIFRVRMDAKSRHFLNPSNSGIAFTLLLLPSVGISPPYQFTENVNTSWDWVIPSVIILTGTLLNATLTKKMPLISGWIGGFLIQAALRSVLFGEPLLSQLMPMTAVSFILFTNYMITDPATTPVKAKYQVLFGSGIALVYGILLSLNIVYTLFFSLTIVCVVRGLWIKITQKSIGIQDAALSFKGMSA